MTVSISHDTPLCDLPVVSLDLETTGLDVTRDRIVQVGVVQVPVADSSALILLDALVNPGISIPPRSTSIHGISDEDVTTAVEYVEMHDLIRDIVDERVVIGHHIGFDIAVLRHESARLKRSWRPPHTLDIALLAVALLPELRDHSMEGIAAWFDVKVSARHTAVGDSQTVADLFVKLLPLLVAQGIDTLGKAKNLASTCGEQIARERREGWYHDLSVEARARDSGYQQQVDELRDIKRNQASRAREELEAGVPAIDIQAQISRTNIELHQRALKLCLDEFVGQDLGDPPVDFDAIIIGSGSRCESLVYPDQDNGFILSDDADKDPVIIDDWFEGLAVRLTDTLAAIGFYRCPGWIMATNPRWRKPVTRFAHQIEQWISEASGEGLHYCNIILDFDNFYGEGRITKALHESTMTQARSSRFLQRLYQVHKNQTGALGWFNRIVTDPNPGPNQGKIDLKTGGSLPLVTAVRIFIDLSWCVRVEYVAAYKTTRSTGTDR